MQGELDVENSGTEIQILGINSWDSESGNASITQGRILPWLQDTVEEDVWIDWAVTYRDVYILNPDNSVFAIYNLSEHDLNETHNYDELKGLFLEAAAR